MEGFKEFLRHEEEGYTEQEVVNMYLMRPERRVTEIARLTGRSTAEIYRILHGYEVTPNRLRTKHQHVLSFADAGLSIPQIAELTGYTPRNVRYILNRLKNEAYGNRS